MLPKTSYIIYINVIKIDIIHIVRRYDKVPNSGLGPKWDQSAKMVPKKKYM